MCNSTCANAWTSICKWRYHFLGCHNKIQKPGGIFNLKLQKFFLSQFWRPEVQSPGVHGAILPLEALWENLLPASFSFWRLLAFLGLQLLLSLLYPHITFPV